MIVSNELCYICGEISDFTIVDNATLLREATCKYCNASIRNSDTARIVMKTSLGEELPLSEGIDLLIESKITILEAQASGPIHNLLKHLPNYTSFEYYDELEPGEYKDGILNNDFEQLTFEDASFDIIISQDVLEHIENPERALAEINRVLKINGTHVFTIPLHEASKTKSRKNARPVFHGDPLSKLGVLVHTDWGTDILDIIDSFGMRTQQINLHKFYESTEITEVDISYKDYLTSSPLQYYRYNSIVFHSKKIENYGPTTKDNKELRLLQYGPNEIIESRTFNEQPSGESAVWAIAEHATKSTIIKIDDIDLVSHYNDQRNLVTAIVPAWLYKFKGEHQLFLYDPVSKKKSNSLSFVVKSSTSSEYTIDSDYIHLLQQENYNLSKELYKTKNNLKPAFNGWGMTTNHQLPWRDSFNWDTFRESSVEIKKAFNFGLKEDIGIDADNIDSLLWRHWIVVFALHYTLKFKKSDAQINLVECGVGDGMSAFFVLKEMSFMVSKSPEIQYQMHLYDSWDTLHSEDLTERELHIEGRYANNSLERVRNNLIEFQNNIRYHVGYIPYTFTEPLSNISYLHIDLNSANATLETLQYFYPSLSSGSVILFDDYGWSGFEETKETIDTFFSNKPGILLKLPTSQAIYFYK